MAEGRRNQSYAALRAVLPTVRDRLTVGEAAQRAPRLPLPTRGIYCERCNPSSVPHKIGARDFVERVRHGCPSNLTMSGQELVHGVVTASRNHLGGSQWDHVVAILPRELRSVLASQ
jgi:uncharacterized protein (DUF2267 family)